MMASAPSSAHRRARNRRLIIGAGALVGLMIVLTALVIFWLPGYVKSQLEIRLTGLLQRPVTVEAVEIKLSTLELTISGFRIAGHAEASEKPQSLFSFTKLHVDAGIESIVRGTPVIASVTLTEPSLRLVRETEDRFNFSDLLEKFAATGTEKESGQSTRFSIANIEIQGGQLEFDDHFLQSSHRITGIDLRIPLVANSGGEPVQWIEPHLGAEINGAPFSLDGKLQMFAERQQAMLTVKLDRFDLTRLGRHIALPPGIALLSGRLNGDWQVTFEQQGNEAPKIELSGIAGLAHFAIGNDAVAAPYRLDLQSAGLVLSQVDLMHSKPAQFKLDLAQIALTRTAEREPAVALDKLSVDAITVDAAKRRLTVGEVSADSLQVRLQRDADKTIDLTRLFAATSLIDSTSSAAQAETGGEDASWSTAIKRVNLKSAAVHYSDLAMAKPVSMVVDGLDLTLDDIDATGTKPANIAVQAHVNQKGGVKANGTLTWNPLTADLAVRLEAVDIVSLQGWAGDKLNAVLTGGDVSFDGTIGIHGEPAKIALNGQGALANFALLDAGNSQDLLRWKKLEIGGVDFVNEPLQIKIKTIGLQDYFARLTILPDGSLNLQQIVRREPAGAAGAGAGGSPVHREKALPVFIDKIVLRHGGINFRDRFIKPNYRANLTGLSGQIGPLHPGKPGTIDIVGALDKTAPLQIKGDIDPFATDLWLDIAVKVKGIDLPPLSPYSAKYAGYAIEKGKLSADVYYRVEKGTLNADNKIFLDQFTLGDAVASEASTSLPLDLAIALLKNRRGEIDIHLPLQGALDDPQFNLGDIVFTAFVNLISKAVTSPFTLLGSVLEHAEELSEITFIPGFSNIEAESAGRLQMLAGVLDDRPALKLEIVGHYDPNLDRDGLKLALLQNKVKAQKLATDAEQSIAGGALEDIALSRQEYDKYLKIAYQKETFDKPRNAIGLAKSLPGEEMERLMLAHIEVGENDLQVLAENRAIAARNWLIEHGEIPGERIFVVGVHESGEAEQKAGSRVEFLLK